MTERQTQVGGKKTEKEVKWIFQETLIQSDTNLTPMQRNLRFKAAFPHQKWIPGKITAVFTDP